MSMYDYNESQAYLVAQIHHQQLMREMQNRQREKEQLRSLVAERSSQRQFRLAYRVRHWLNRLAPGVARTIR